MTFFNMFLEKDQVLALFWHLNGNFPEDQSCIINEHIPYVVFLH